MAYPTNKQVLKKMRDLLQDRARWTRGDFARRADGTGCDWSDPQAVSFCAIGALYKVTDEDFSGMTHRGRFSRLNRLDDLLRGGAERLGYGGIVGLNDLTDETPQSVVHELVLKAIDDAIAHA